MSVLWAAFWLAAVLVSAKAAELGLPSPLSVRHLWAWLSNLAIATAADDLFVLCVAAPALISVLATAWSPRLQRIVWWVWLVAYAIFACYAVVSVLIFSYTRTPLTRHLIAASGSFSDMASSIGAFATVSAIAALVLVPLAYVVVVRFSSRRTGTLRGRAAWAALIAAVVVVAAQLGYARHERSAWLLRPDWHVADNPHWALLASSPPWEMGSRQFNLPQDIPASYFDDFRPASQRPAAPVLALPWRPKNVLIFVMESVGTQHLGLFGGRFHVTPHLEAEAAHSLIFENFYCHVGMTPSSQVAINSANYPITIWQPRWDDTRPLWQPGILLAEVLKEQGFRTAMISSSDIYFAHQRGFLEGRGYDDILDEHDLKAPALFSWGVADGAMVDNVLAWIDRRRDQPFFALCWTAQTHHPYRLLPGRRERDLVRGKVPTNGSLLNRYLNCVVETDRQLGRLLDALRQRGIADDTLVCITGDHGEGFNWPHESLGHGFRIYDENVHIPLLLWNPRLFHGERRATIGALIDLAPTITDILGFEPAPVWTGHSLFDPNRRPRAYFYGAHSDVLLGLREGQWHYIYNATTGTDELYSLSADRLEQDNVAAAHEAECGIFRRRIAAWVRYIDAVRLGRQS